MLIGLMVLVLTFGSYAEPAPQAGAFPIPGHGSLRFDVPNGWQAVSQPLQDPASLTLHFKPKNGNAFEIQVTTVWLDSEKLAKVTSVSLKENLQQAANGVLERSVEKTATIQEMRGAHSIGHYYSLTDRSPGPGEFTYLTQGSFLTGEVLSVVTILHRTPAEPEVARALRLFAGATYAK